MAGHLSIARWEMLNSVSEALAIVAAEVKAQGDQDIAALERKLADLRAENIELTCSAKCCGNSRATSANSRTSIASCEAYSSACCAGSTRSS
jgi:hypothetical protein